MRRLWQTLVEGGTDFRSKEAMIDPNRKKNCSSGFRTICSLVLRVQHFSSLSINSSVSSHSSLSCCVLCVDDDVILKCAYLNLLVNVFWISFWCRLLCVNYFVRIIQKWRLLPQVHIHSEKINFFAQKTYLFFVNISPSHYSSQQALFLTGNVQVIVKVFSYETGFYLKMMKNCVSPQVFRTD